MSSSTATIPPAKALQLHSLITLTAQGIASRVLTKTSGGNLTLFAFDAGQGLAEHTSPFDALVLVLEGTLTLTIGETAVRAKPGTIVRMPAGVAQRPRLETYLSAGAAANTLVRSSRETGLTR